MAGRVSVGNLGAPARIPVSARPRRLVQWQLDRTLEGVRLDRWTSHLPDGYEMAILTVSLLQQASQGTWP